MTPEKFEAYVELLSTTYIAARLFIHKVNLGKAKSQKTYSDMLEIVKLIDQLRFIDSKVWKRVMENFEKFEFPL